MPRTLASGSSCGERGDERVAPRRGSGRACGAGGGRARRGRGSRRGRRCSMRAVPRSASSFWWATGSTRPGGSDEPAQPQRGRERLARRARVDDVLGVEALERADGGAVVAVLRVVVVLDRRSRPRSRSQATSSARRAAGEDDAGRVLVRGREDDGVRARSRRARRPACPPPSTGTRTEPSPARAALHSASGSLGSSTARRRAPRVRERVQDDVEALGVAGGDQHARRVGDDAADAAEVLGERGAQDAARRAGRSRRARRP